jgi:23S rRNA pseudouridine1911/1915/1917 synthase
MPETKNANRGKYVALAHGQLDGAVRTGFDLSWGKARETITSGKIRVNGEVVTDTTRKVIAGAEIELNMNAPRPNRSRLEADRILYVDPHLVIVSKPPGISTVAYDETETDTLDDRVRRALEAREKNKGAGRSPLGVVHRIDKETSGLLVFTRTWLAKQSLSQQFRAHTVHRRYLAIVHGEARAQTIRSHLVANRGDGLRGSIERQRKPIPREQAQLAITHVEIVDRLDGATLIGCRLETGRTHQIRVHLSEEGNPIVGERVYIRNYEGELIPAPRVMLHAAELGFVHPALNKEMRWNEPAPKDFEDTALRLKTK